MITLILAATQLIPPAPRELLSSHLFRAGISSRDMTLLWRVLPAFVLLV